MGFVVTTRQAIETTGDVEGPMGPDPPDVSTLAGVLQDGLDGEVAAGVLPAAVLAAVAGGEVDGGPVGEVHRQPGHVAAATGRAVAPGAGVALRQGAEGRRRPVLAAAARGRGVLGTGAGGGDAGGDHLR